jgi:hypothetical protein
MSGGSEDRRQPKRSSPKRPVPPAAERADAHEDGVAQAASALQRSARSVPIRPDHVRALQRNAGNSSVTRLLTSSSAPEVQRAPGPTEFRPSIAEPGAVIPLRVFSPYTHVWSMTTWNTAPRGSSFHWGYALEADSVAVLKGATTSHRGATTRVNVQARTPGRFAIQGTPVHQVPGGPRVTGDVRRAQFVVSAPTVATLGIMPRKPDGSGSDTQHLSVGDKLVVRVRVGGVDGKHMENPAAVTYTGASNVTMTAGPTAVQSFPDGRSYDLEFTTTAPGTMNLSLELGIGDAVLGRGPKAEPIRATVEYDRQEFINLCNQCHTRIDQAYTQANSIMEVLSAAYGNAYDAHLATLKAQDASNRLAEEIVLGAVLAFIPGGVGGVVGNWMRDAGANAFLVDAVKDLAKAGTRGVQGAATASVMPGAGGAMQPHPLKPDPRTWRAEYAVKVNNEKQVVLADLDRWLTGANQRSPSFAMDFNPLETMKAALKKNNLDVATTPVPDRAENQKSFELGMWKLWLETYAYTAEARMSCGGGYSVVVENSGKKIRDRLDALGVSGEEWITTYGGVAKRRAEGRQAVRP